MVMVVVVFYNLREATKILTNLRITFAFWCDFQTCVVPNALQAAPQMFPNFPLFHPPTAAL